MTTTPPATSKQLWYLHILTGQDTREWKLTLAEASAKINELKAKPKRPLVNPHATAIKRDQQLKAQMKYDRTTNMLGGLRITEAYKAVSIHPNGICVQVHASGVFPRGKVSHTLSFSHSGNGGMWVTPLYSHIRNDVTIPLETYQTWIKSLPIKNSKTMSIPDSLWDKALSLAQQVDKYIAIIPL